MSNHDETLNTNDDLARIARNRANARHSTGPKTEAGKQRSSLNTLRHGLTGHTIVLPTEDLAAYQRFTKRFFDDLKPIGILEEQLVQSIADTSWRLNRIPALENNLLTLGLTEHAGRINTEHPEVHAPLAMAEALREQTRAFAALSLHGQRLSRQFEKALKQLRELQSERCAAENLQLRQAVAPDTSHQLRVTSHAGTHQPPATQKNEASLRQGVPSGGGF